VSVPSYGRRVFVTDDSNTVRRSTEIFFKLGGQQVLLGLPDMVMPGQNGFQLNRVIALYPLNSDKPTSMRARKYQGTQRVLGIRHGTHDAMTKPEKADALKSQSRALG
jgi:DNA-binding response OmpR family regulator